MQVDVSFSNAKVYDINKFDVVLGQKFLLTTDSADRLRWFSDQDAVLSLSDDGITADVEATGLGESTILLMDGLFTKLKELTIKVVSAISEPAKSLGLTADAPILKAE